jgi:hypothetical protein
VNDYLYFQALDALAVARKTRRLDDQDYRYFIETFQATPNPQAFEVLCLEVIREFRPVWWKPTEKQKRLAKGDLI